MTDTNNLLLQESTGPSPAVHFQARAKRIIDTSRGDEILNDPNYRPGRFVDWLVHEVFAVRTDAGLSEVLNVRPETFSNIRHRRKPIGPTMLIRVHDITGLPISELRRIAGLKHTT